MRKHTVQKEQTDCELYISQSQRRKDWNDPLALQNAMVFNSNYL